jgi:hypothetical protein
MQTTRDITKCLISPDSNTSREKNSQLFLSRAPSVVVSQKQLFCCHRLLNKNLSIREISVSHDDGCEDAVFWIIAPFILAEVCRRFCGAHCYQTTRRNNAEASHLHLSIQLYKCEFRDSTA